ncbi:MAG: 1,2-phenylacetyl-CoA epoxidase subunit PaaB [Marinicellaceae bacterium]
MKLFEVFIRAKAGLNHKHVGSVHATDAQMAMQNARDLYTRREEGESIWVVDSNEIVSSNPTDKDAYFEPAEDKIYRHPSFYPFDKEVKNI